MTLMVVGSVGLDTVETPLAKREEQLGGSASYFSAAAALISPIRLVGVVGEDFPQKHLVFLQERGVDTEGLMREKGLTFRWSGRYLPNMVDRVTLDTQLNVFEGFRPKLPPSYRDSSYVFLANIDPALQLEVVEQVKRPRFVGLDTMNFWINGPALDRLKTVLQRIDVVFLNDEEARLLSGQENLVKAAATIRLMGVSRVIIKRGDAGALLFDDAGPFWVPAFPLEHVEDPTGAGDAFAGGFMAYLAYHDVLDEAHVRKAMVAGSVTASFAVEAFGLDRFVELKRQDLIDRGHAFHRLVHFGEIQL